MNWFFLNPVDSGLVAQWQAIYGDLTLWDFYAMNAYLKYKDRLSAAMERSRAIKKEANKYGRA